MAITINHQTNDISVTNGTLTIGGEAIGSGSLTEINFTSALNTKLAGIETGATADQTAAEILTAIKTVDGTGTGLDADLLDGQHGTYYTGYTDTAIANLVATAPATLDTLNELATALGNDPNFATTVTNSIGTKAASAVTISAGAGLTGGGNLTANRTISHADTSTQASLTALTGANVISDVDVDTYGHVTAMATRTMTAADLGAITGNQTITLSGDVSGSGTTSIVVTVADDSHNHIIGNVDGLQTALDGKASTSHNHTLDSLSNTTITANTSGEILKWDGSAWVNNTLSEAGIQPSGSYLTGNQTVTLSGDLTGSGTTSINAQIAANVVGANELNVVGNGTTAQYLRSDGDGTFTWATPTDTNTTYSAGTGLSLVGTTFSNASPDQTVTLTQGGATTITGTYPNFTISSTDTNTTYSVGNGGLTEINFTTALNSKLAGIEAGATADQTAAEILTAIKTVDGSGSGLDADLLDGQHGSYYQPASTAITTSNIGSQSVSYATDASYAGYAETAGRAYPKRVGGGDLNFNWSGQSGQPPWLWGGSDGSNMYVYNPSNFSVAYAASAGTVATATTAANLTSTSTTWNNNTVINAVVGQLAWKNYGNNHVIFDASASTSPSGTSVNNSNPVEYWSPSYPTLMGWNGSETYGVRVDRARYAEYTAPFLPYTGQVGSYTLAIHASANTTVSADTSYSGTVLSQAGFITRTTNTSNGEYPFASGAALYGTWRCLATNNHAPAYSTVTNYYASLFIRIA